MIPRAPERIATMVRALTDVVLPSIDPANSLAQEQARLVVAQLLVLSGQRDEALLDRLELAGEISLARSLLAIAPGGSASEAAQAALGKALDEVANRAADEPATARGIVRAGIEALVRAATEDGGEALRQATWTRVLAHARGQAERGRAWFAAAGFDDRPMPAPSAMLAAFARATEEEKAR